MIDFKPTGSTAEPCPRRARLPGALLVLPAVPGCGDKHTDGYWQDPRDDNTFEGWADRRPEEPEPEEPEPEPPEICELACAEIEGCYELDALRTEDFQMTTFLIPEGECMDLCVGGALRADVWDCFADQTGNGNPTYCKNKDLCYKRDPTTL